MRRRDFVAAVGGTTALPLAARAQQPAMPVIGFLSSASRETYTKRLEGFHRGLTEAGYVEGRNVIIEYRWANNQHDRLPELANELVRQQVRLIVATGGTPSAIAAKKATATIPIVFQGGSDPVKLGLVASLNRPGGNVTGASNISNELHAKRLELLREFVPTVGTIAILLNPSSAAYTTDLADIRSAAMHLGQQILIVNAGTDAQIDPALASIVGARAGALLVAADSLFTNLRQRLVGLVARHSLPASYPFREFVFAGGLFCYGPDLVDSTYKVGIYAGRILKGASPMDLPVIQPTKFELVINLKTARTLGLTVSPTLLARADEVIE